jgi:hypothetical protein
MLILACCSCAPLLPILDDILISCQNTATLDSAHQLFRTLTANPKFSNGADSTEMLDEVLEGLGFGGLWRSATFHTANDLLRQCTNLTDRLIGVCESDFTACRSLRNYTNMLRSSSLHDGLGIDDGCDLSIMIMIYEQPPDDEIYPVHRTYY